MRAIVLEQPGNLKRITKEHPGKPGPGEVLLKMKMLGICGTDLHAFHGNQPFFAYPRILGHEIAAEVVETGKEVTHLQVGDLCTIIPYRNTGEDQAMRRGKSNCGTTLKVFGVHEDGAMQEYFLYDAKNVFPANGLALKQIAIIEPLAIGSHAIERAGISAADSVLIVGGGPIGIAAVAMGLLKTTKIIVTDINQQRLDFIKSKFPMVSVLLATKNLSQQLRELLNGDNPTIVMDATGNKESMSACIDNVAHGGTVVYIGLFIGDIVIYDPDFHRKEITLKASRNALPEDFTKIIDLLKSGQLNMDGYVTHQLNFDNLCEDFSRLYLPEENVIKAVVSY